MNSLVVLCIVGMAGFDAIWLWRFLRIRSTLKPSDHLFYFGQNLTLAALILIMVGPGQWIVEKVSAAVLAFGVCGAYLIVSAKERRDKARTK